MPRKKTIKEVTKKVAEEHKESMQNLADFDKQPQEVKTTQTSTPKIEPETVSIPKAEWENVEKTLEMLKSVADKGRVYNYESSQKTDKKPKKVKLSCFGGGLIIGWQTMKDELVKHPVTGATVGENQQIQVKILMPNGDTITKDFSSYVQFSNARYDERCECFVSGVSESYDGKIVWILDLPDGRKLNIDPRFVN